MRNSVKNVLIQLFGVPSQTLKIKLEEKVYGWRMMKVVGEEEAENRTS